MVLLSWVVSLAALVGAAQVVANNGNGTSSNSSSSNVVATIYPATANGTAVGIHGTNLSGFDAFLGVPFAQARE